MEEQKILKALINNCSKRELQIVLDRLNASEQKSFSIQLITEQLEHTIKQMQ